MMLTFQNRREKSVFHFLFQIQFSAKYGFDGEMGRDGTTCSIFSSVKKKRVPGIFFSICVEGNEIIIHPESAKVSFDVTHIGKTTVYGSFKSFDGIIFVKDNRFIKAQGKIYIDSIETNNKVRNAYLKSKKFFFY